MTPVGKILPRTEVSFRRKYLLVWNIVGFAAIVVGLILGPRMHRWSHSSSWLCVVVALALYAGSILLCQVVLLWLWRKPHVTSAVLFFSIPIGAAGLGAVYLMRAAGPSLLHLELRQQYGLYLAVGLLYAASLFWAIGVALKRKKLGKFDIEDYG